MTEPPEGRRLVIVMKEGINPVQDSLGRVVVPFSSIAYMEYFEKDRVKSNRNTILLVTGGIAGLLIWFFIEISDMEFDFHGHVD